MATTQPIYDHFTNPVDMVEHIATIHDWTFERSAPDELTLTVAGTWCDYHISLTWRDDLEALHLACAFEFKVAQAPARRDLQVDGADQRAALARPFRPVEGGRHAALPPRPAARRRRHPCRPMRGAAEGCARGLRALLSVLPIRACGRASRQRTRSPPRCSKRKDTHDTQPRRPAALVGAGKMGGALLEGWLRQGLDPAQRLHPGPGAAAGGPGARCAPQHAAGTAPDLPAPPSVIVLAVKPDLVAEADARTRADDRRADRGAVDRRGADAAQSRPLLPQGTAIVRAMPNTRGLDRPQHHASLAPTKR